MRADIVIVIVVIFVFAAVIVVVHAAHSQVSTVHGISYVFSRSLPSIDKLLWTISTLTWYSMKTVFFKHQNYISISACLLPSTYRPSQ